jgi:hypothetical protein
MARARVPGSAGNDTEFRAAGATGPPTVNEAFMDAHWAAARGFTLGLPANVFTDQASEIGGMMHVVPVKLLPRMKLYRFGTGSDDKVIGGPWWFGFSAYQALMARATQEKRTLRDVARERLAVFVEWNLMDVLLHAEVRQPLSAWSGTPRTARAKQEGHYGGVLTPDRAITQLYIPGLSERGPDGTRLCSRALAVIESKKLIEPTKLQ